MLKKISTFLFPSSKFNSIKLSIRQVLKRVYLMSHAFSKIISRLGDNWCNWLRRLHWCKMTRTIVAWIFLCISCFRLFYSFWRLVICLANQRYSEYISLHEESFTLHITHICARRVYVYVCAIDFYEVQRPNILITTLPSCFCERS